MIDVAPQDVAMDTFRSHFHLVANCNVTSDGKKMNYQLRTKENASVWLHNAENIIKAGDLPLVAELNTNLCGIFLHIIYKPACHGK